VTPALTYVYCLVKRPRRPSLRTAPPGIGGGEVRALDAGDGVWLIVTTVPESAYGEAALALGLQNLDWVGRQAITHETIVERFLTAPAVLPMQLFTLFTSDERALQHVRRDRRRINTILTRLERQVEWGLRLTLDEKAPPSPRPRAGGRRALDQAERSRRTAADGRVGTAYLAHKREQLDVVRTRLADATADADRLYRTVARAATAAVRRAATEAVPGSRLVLDAAFLVPRQRAAAFRALVRRHGRPLSAAGLAVSLTGPWPPYNFIDSRARTARRG